jgi:DNA (cytosine-5)-methyltransferase 1
MLSFLSAVDMLRPRYVVIENVRGLLTYRLDNMESNRTRLTGGIAQGMMKVIKRVLTAMKSVE